MDVSAFGPHFLLARMSVREADLDEKNMVLYIVAQLKTKYDFTGSKELFAYSITEEKLLWSLKFEEHSRYLRVDTIPMVSHSSITRALHPRTGKLLWASRIEVNRTLTGNKTFAVGYTIITGQRGEFKAMEPATGNALWSFPYTHHTSSGTVAMVSDTTMVIFGSDLVFLNLFTGEAIRKKVDVQPMYTYNDEVSSALSDRLISDAFFFIETDSEDMDAPILGRKLFNCTMHDGVIYHASGKEVKAFSINGEELWTHQFSKTLVGTSKLWLYGGHLYLMNFETRPNEDPAFRGAVFMAKFKPEDGTVVAINESVMRWGYIIRDFTMMDSAIVFSLVGRLVSANLNNLAQIAEGPFSNVNLRPQNGSLTRPTHLLSKSGTLEEIASTRPGYGYLLNIAYSHIEFDPKLTLTKEIQRKRFYYFSSRIGNRILLSNEDVRILFDENLKELPLRFSLNMRIYENYICDWKDHSVVVLPISALLADF